MRKAVRVLLLVLLGILAVLVIGTAVLLLLPNPTPSADPDPAADYDEALERIAELESRDTGDVIRPTIFIGQDERTERSVVIFHGFTNNPEQFQRIGEAYHAAGYNVLIPRLPEHGKSEIKTRDLTKITPERLVEATDEAIDIGAGLGEEVEVVGLSGGGTLATWAAYERDEVKRAIIISPLFGVDLLPSWVVRPVVAWSRVLPDVFLWWDWAKRGKDHVPPDAYPGYSLSSIASFFMVGYDVMGRDPQRQGSLERVVLVTNGADRSVDEGTAREVFDEELVPFAEEVERYEYPESLGYAHDLIDPEGTNAEHIDDIYRVLYEYLELPPE